MTTTTTRTTTTVTRTLTTTTTITSTMLLMMMMIKKIFLVVVVFVIFGGAKNAVTAAVTTTTNAAATTTTQIAQQQQQQQSPHHDYVDNNDNHDMLLAAAVVAPQRQQQQRQQLSSSSSSLLLFLSTKNANKKRMRMLMMMMMRGGGSGSSGSTATTSTTTGHVDTTAITTTARGGGGGGTTVRGGGTATIPTEIFNLIKGIVGAGVLSLPAGIAAFGDTRSAVLPAIILITIIGALSGYGFILIGKVCHITGDAISYRDAWERSISSKTSWIPAWSTTLKTSLACLAYSMILTDTFGSLLRINLDQYRIALLTTITCTILLPLCWLKNLSSLAPFSLLGVLGMLYTVLGMFIRYIDGSYTLPNGKLLSSITSSKFIPAFGTTKGINSVFHPNSLILVSMLSTAYMAHFNAPKFYNELQNNTISRFNIVVVTAFAVSILLMIAVASFGYLTFGTSCSGLVLNNYANTDIIMSGSRIAVAISLVFSYPLAFQGCRDGIIDLLQIIPIEKRTQPAFLNITTIVLLTIITFIASIVKDVSLVLAIGGATLGNALTYVYPAMMYRSAIQKKKQQQSDNNNNKMKAEERIGVIIASMMACAGIIMGTIGTYMAITQQK